MRSLDNEIENLRSIKFRDVIETIFLSISKNNIKLINSTDTPMFKYPEKEMHLDLTKIKNLTSKKVSKFNLTFLEFLHEFAHSVGQKIRKDIFLNNKAHEEAIAELFSFIVIQKLGFINDDYVNHVYEFLERYNFNYELCWKEAIKTYKYVFET